MAKAKLDEQERAFFNVALKEGKATLDDVNSFLRAKAGGETLQGFSTLLGMKEDVFYELKEKAKSVMQGNFDRKSNADDIATQVGRLRDGNGLNLDVDGTETQVGGAAQIDVLDEATQFPRNRIGLENRVDLDIDIDSIDTQFGSGSAQVGAQDDVTQAIDYKKVLKPKSVTRRVMAEVPDGNERYQDLKELGRGGMGAVYRARDTRLGREVALKVILKEDKDAITRFMREARLCAELESHPNIITIHDIERMAGKYFISMKLVSSGKDLGDIIDESFDGRKPRSRNDFLRVVRSICNAMAFAHEKNIIHRDLKPANIMVDAHEQTYVMDWGLAKKIRDSEGKLIKEDPLMKESIVPNNDDVELSTCQLTENGVTVGSPLWMAPEQAQAGEVIINNGVKKEMVVDERSDIYSVGAILYECLTGVQLRDVSKGLPGILVEALTNSFRVPRKIDSTIPRDLEGVVLKALKTDSDERYPSFREFGEDLRCVLDGEKVSSATYKYPLSNRGARWFRKHPRIFATGASILLAAGIAGPIIAKLSSDKAAIVASELEKAKKRNLASEEYWKGDEALKRGELERALERFTRASEIDSEWGDAYFGMGRAAHQITLTGDRTHRKGIEEYLVRANELSLKSTGRVDVRALVELGIAASDIDGDIVKANKFLEQVLAVAGEPEGSDDPYAVLAGSIVAYNRGDIPRAIKLGNKAVEMSRMAEAYLHLSVLLSPRAIFGLRDRRLDSSADYVRAKQLALAAAEELDKNNWMMHQQVSALCIREGEYEKALEEVEKIHNLGIRSQGVDYLQGEALQKLKKYNEALRVLDESEKRWGPRGDIIVLKGTVYMNSSRLEEAEAEFRRSLSLKETADAAGGVAAVLERRKNYPAALDWRNKAVKLKPDFDSAYEQRGVCYELRGDDKKKDIESARKDYEKAMDLGSNLALYRMGSLLLRHGKTDDDYRMALDYTQRYLASGDTEQRVKAEKLKAVLEGKLKK